MERLILGIKIIAVATLTAILGLSIFSYLFHYDVLIFTNRGCDFTLLETELVVIQIQNVVRYQ